jgi:cell division protein FtsQ
MSGSASSAGRSRAMKVRQAKSPSRSKGQRTLLGLALGAVTLTAALAVGGVVANEAIQESGGGRIEAMLTAAGFGIDEVTVTGHAMTADTDIFDALDLAHIKTMPALRSVQVQERLTRLPWIATATLTRVYPGRIELLVTERLPSAVWLNGEKATLIDGTGRTLSAVRATDLPALPRISGSGAPRAASALFQMLTHFPLIATRLRVAIRVDDRRWSLDLSDATRLELPSEGEATALIGLLSDAQGREILNSHNTVIDLRSPTIIAARPTRQQ